MQENEYGTARIQKELLALIKQFHAFCAENGIQYCLYAGSCLGAVRHNGFIPWDDDLDIIVTRDNYNRLMEKIVTSKEIMVHKTIWVDRVQRRDSEKIREYVPTLDIFIADHAPDSAFVFRFKVFLLRILQGMLKEEVSYEGFSLPYRLALGLTHGVGRLFTVNRRRKWYDSASQIGNKKPSNNVHCSNGLYKVLPIRFDGDQFSAVALHKFEDTELYIPRNYDKYLTQKYGDYMTPPQESQRRPEHVKE